MPSASPAITPFTQEALTDLGRAVRSRREALGINATAAAEAAGMSRVTWHRIEKGEASVTMGAWLAACTALGLRVQAQAPCAVESPGVASRKGWIPARVRIADYPQLKELAWQVQGATELTPREALDIYERNWRHVDAASLLQEERDLVAALRLALGNAGGV